ncbi:hypothetical protein HGRIS_014254 [Hohenbuehelia grisea]|uniref:Sucrase n=1 Tax=Hohenbuehelia grisea TaxID=104357 RepID=A0ABR3JSS6_9AGAR
MLNVLLQNRRFPLTLSPFIGAWPTRFASKLAGTVASHQAYILLHATMPPSEFPSKFSTRLQRNLQLKVMQWGGIVNFSWSPDQPTLLPDDKTEQCCATAFFTSGKRVDIPKLTLDNLDTVEQALKHHATASLGIQRRHDTDVYLYVCSHGARDCRCGEYGTQLVNALRTEYQHLVYQRNGHVPRTRVHIAEVAHVGGHKHAANLIMFPQGEWLGDLRAEHASTLLQAILEKQSHTDTEDIPLLPHHWRGRMGLNNEEQQLLYSRTTGEV